VILDLVEATITHLHLRVISDALHPLLVSTGTTHCVYLLGTMTTTVGVVHPVLLQRAMILAALLLLPILMMAHLLHLLDTPHVAILNRRPRLGMPTIVMIVVPRHLRLLVIDMGHIHHLEL
jgi:hypothetical protein